MIHRVAANLAALFLALLQTDASNAQSNVVPLNPQSWSGGGVAFEKHLGRRAMRLDKGEAVMSGLDLREGVIEFDVAIKDRRGFAGVHFHRRDAGTAEAFYLRSHQSGNPDANQYTPIFHGLAGWQIYYGPQFSAATAYRHEQWMNVRLIVRGAEAEVHFDGRPVLRFDLLGDFAAGGIALWTHTAPAWFSNIRISDQAPQFALPAPPPHKLAPGTVEEWEVSEPFASELVDSVERLDPSWLADLRWTLLQAEPNGIANLARVANPEAGDTVLARVTIPAERASRFSFGFSDSARLYANGHLVYAGEDRYGSRDYRFLGTVGLYDTVYTRLNEGEVEFVFAVRENFGGWAVAGAATPR